MKRHFVDRAASLVYWPVGDAPASLEIKPQYRVCRATGDAVGGSITVKSSRVVNARQSLQNVIDIWRLSRNDTGGDGDIELTPLPERRRETRQCCRDN